MNVTDGETTDFYNDTEIVFYMDHQVTADARYTESGQYVSTDPARRIGAIPDQNHLNSLKEMNPVQNWPAK